MKYANSITISRMICTQCGNEGMPIPRKAGKQREAGHLKVIFCLHCQKETNHCEIRPFGNYTYENFKEEFELGRFLEDGTRIAVKDLPSCKHPECKCNKSGKCWNSNGSYASECAKLKEVGNNG